MKLNGYICDLCGSIVYNRNYLNSFFIGTNDIGVKELCPKCYKIISKKINEEIKNIKKDIKKGEF